MQKSAGSIPGGVDQLRREILDLQSQCRECESEIERYQGDFQNNETIFKESKIYV